MKTTPKTPSGDVSRPGAAGRVDPPPRVGGVLAARVALRVAGQGARRRRPAAQPTSCERQRSCPPVMSWKRISKRSMTANAGAAPRGTGALPESFRWPWSFATSKARHRNKPLSSFDARWEPFKAGLARGRAKLKALLEKRGWSSRRSRTWAHVALQVVRRRQPGPRRP